MAYITPRSCRASDRLFCHANSLRFVEHIYVQLLRQNASDSAYKRLEIRRYFAICFDLDSTPTKRLFRGTSARALRVELQWVLGHVRRQ